MRDKGVSSSAHGLKSKCSHTRRPVWRGWEARLVVHPTLQEPCTTVLRAAPPQRHIMYISQVIKNFLVATSKKKVKKNNLKLIVTISCI